ncbi:hypothetical protein AQ861_14820 [Burkholderia pseudomallei]|nr:hypothetical protein AQ861_14820 [Burkholderia pseudomallei]
MAFYDPFFISRSNRLRELLADSVHHIASGAEERSHEYVPKLSREFSCHSSKEIELKCLLIRKVGSPEITESGHQRRAVKVVAGQPTDDLLKGGTQSFIGARRTSTLSRENRAALENCTDWLAITTSRVRQRMVFEIQKWLSNKPKPFQ